MSKTKKKKPVAGKSTTTKNPQSPSGRPAGSISDQCEPVKAVKPMCVKCHSANLLRKNVLRELEHITDHDGVTTTHRRWTRAMCRACGQWQTIREDFNP